MTLFFHELRRSRVSLAVWTAVIAFMLAITVLIYPQMAQQMESVTQAFSEMGAFSSAFGMDKLNFGELTDYFCVECANTLGLGGALFAAISAAAALAGEEKERTCEFLYTQPVSRGHVLASKLAALFAKVFILHAVVSAVTLLSVLAIGKEVKLATVLLVLCANLILSLEIASVSFAISSVASGGSMAAAIGLVFAFYFMNIVANITDKAEFLKYITPYGYTEGSQISADGTLAWVRIAIGAGLSLVCVALAFIRYRRKDL